MSGRLNLAFGHGHIPTVRPRVAQILVVVAVDDVTPRLPQSEFARHRRTDKKLGVLGVGVDLVIPAEIHRIAAGVGSERSRRIHRVGFPVADIHRHRHALLTDIAQAGNLPRLLTGTTEHGKQDCRQNGDNRNYDQQFNEGKPAPTHWSASFRSKFKTADETQLGVSAAIKPEGDTQKQTGAVVGVQNDSRTKPITMVVQVAEGFQAKP